VDDTAGLWVDLNDNGVFEATGSSGSELIAAQGCCGDGPTGTATLLPNKSYNVAFAVEDTGGGGSMTVHFAKPGGVLATIDPSNVAQAGTWSIATPGTGGIVSINGNAELRAARADGLTSLLLNGSNAKAVLTASGVSDSVNAVSTSMAAGGTGTLELGANHTVIANTLSVAPNTILVKTGAGTLTATNQSLGNGGTLQVDGGVVNLLGTTIAANGAGNGGGIVANSTATINVLGSVSGPATVNSGGALTVSAAASIGPVTANGTGTAVLSGSVTGSITVNGTASVILNGTASGIATLTGGTLGGNGTLGGLVVNGGGTVAPGNSVGTITTSSLLMHDLGVLAAELQAGSSDKLLVNGTVTLLDVGDITGATLSLSLLPNNGAFTSTPGTIFGLILNDGTDPVVGTFAQGNSISVGGHVFNISYNANLDSGTVGNDVALTYVVPEPGAAVMLLGGMATLVAIGRGRRRR
jgi:hypothetical protein